MSRRCLAYASIAVVAVLCLVGVAIVAVAAGGTALAYQVNGTRVSQRDFDKQLDEIANTKATKQVSHTDGSIDSGTAAQVMNVNILRDILRDVADQRGTKLSDADRTAGTTAAKSQLGANYANAPTRYRSTVAELVAYANALGLKSSDALNAFLTEQALKAHVYVNPRYGQWRPRQGGVCPPSGCPVSGG